MSTFSNRMSVCIPLRSLTGFYIFKHHLRATELAIDRSATTRHYHATVLFLFQTVDPQPLFSAFSRPLSLFPAETSQTPPTPVFGGSSEVVNRSRPPAIKL